MKPSKQYRIAVREGARHHASSKTYSGQLLRPHKAFIADMVTRLGINSALDYGAGKGLQYEWVDERDGRTIEQTWGFDVDRYDPCWPPYEAEPETRPYGNPWDLVLCTHTLALIPLADHAWVIPRLFRLAGKAVFVAEKIGNRKKREIADPHARAIGRDGQWWVDVFNHQARAHPLPEAVLSIREIGLNNSKITTRYIWRNGEFAEQIRAGSE